MFNTLSTSDNIVLGNLHTLNISQTVFTMVTFLIPILCSSYVFNTSGSLCRGRVGSLATVP